MRDEPIIAPSAGHRIACHLSPENLPHNLQLVTLVKQWAEESDIRDVRRVADWTYRRDKQFRSTDEMAGEPRVKSVLPAAK